MATEDVATILLRFENGARGTVAISQISPGRKNSLRYEIDGVARGRRLGLGAARPALDRPPRRAERDPDPQPGPDEPGRAGRGGPAGRPRRGVRRHVRSPVPGHLRRCRRRRTVGPADRTPRSPTATTRCSSSTRSPRAPDRAAGSTSSAARRPRAPSRRRSEPPRPPPDEARPADRPVPRDAAGRRGRLVGRERVREHRDRLLAAGPPARPGAMPAPATSTWPTCPRARRRTSARRSRPRACTSPASATTPTRSIPTRPIASRSSATSGR